MALAQISMIGPRAEQQKQEKPKKEAIDYILEGLQVAQGITGIAVNYQTIKSKMAENAVAEDKRQGILPITDQAEMAKDFDRVPANTEGSTLMKYRRGDEVESVSILPRKKEAGIRPPIKIETSENGKNVTKVLPEADALNKSFPSPVKDEKPPKDITVQERNTLQNQYDRDPEVRKAKTVLDSYASTQKLLEQKTPASDLALVYNYMKALDPNSVVRETEAETAAALGGLMERAKAQMSNMSGDGMLTDAQRADLARQIESLAGSAGDRLDEIDAQFSDLAKRRNVDMKDLRLTGRSVRPKSSNQAGKSTYRPGTILEINGKRYKVEQDGDTLTEIPAVSGK